MLKQLKTRMQNDEIPALAYYFAKYINQKQPNKAVALAAAILSSENLQGHVCIDLQDYANQSFPKHQDSDIKAPELSTWLSALQQHPWVKSTFPAPLILDDTRLYLGKYWRYENQLASAIQVRLQPNKNLDTALLTAGLQRLFPKTDTEIDWQAVAAAISLLNRFVVISGGPGTGKTSTVIRILALLLAQKPDSHIELVAPTGKAAARLAESIRLGKQSPRLSALTEEEKQAIPETAKTIHRLLKYSPKGFYHHAQNPIPVDTLVIDEASMVDLPLMAKLLTAIPEHTQLILLGDRDQLASVEAGSVLGDITGHGQNIDYPENLIKQLEKLGVIKAGALTPPHTPPPAISRSIALLHKSYRFDANSGIGTAAKYINQRNGQTALQQVLLNPQFPDANWLELEGNELNPKCIQWAVKRYRQYIKQKHIEDALQQFESIRVLTALRNGEFGVENINQKIITALNCPLTGDFHGKPIMISRNDYELDLFNGDIGLIWKNSESEQFYAYFPTADGNIRKISTRQLPQHETAFAMTIHKSQGSEFDHLLMILPPQHNPVVSKELIYTGITRAKQDVLIAGNQAEFINACTLGVKRSSGLSRKLGWSY